MRVRIDEAAYYGSTTRSARLCVPGVGLPLVARAASARRRLPQRYA
ncbi:MAG: hypothetical protein ABSB24_12945 [Gaiellaceae bacterium]